jgi:Domain of unknown function (DUF4136)
MLRKLILTLLLVALPAVAMAEVRVDYDRHKDFSQYRTFNVEIGRLVRPDGSIDEHNTLAENRLRDAVTNELRARGLEPTDTSANLVVRVSERDSDRVSIVSTGWPYSYWNRRWGYWNRFYRYGYWDRPYYGDVLTRRYVEGALTVDVIERDTGALVYRARVTDELGKNLDKEVAKAVDKAFKKFPVKELER